MRYDDAISPWPNWENARHVTHSIGNPDVNWDSAKTFPTQLYPLDTVPDWTEHENVGGETVPGRKLLGRWCMENYRSDYSSEEYAVWIENHDAIPYCHCKDGAKVKLQVFDRDVDIWKVVLDNSRFKAIRIRWAVDAGGDGVFEHPTSARQPTILREGWDTQGKLSTFDIRGRLVPTDAIRTHLSIADGAICCSVGRDGRNAM